MTDLIEGLFPESDLDFNTLLSDLASSENDEDETVPTPYDLHILRCEYWETNNRVPDHPESTIVTQSMETTGTLSTPCINNYTLRESLS